MSVKIKILKLTLIGFRKNYQVEFKNGLNYITGPMSTGKSTILEMINYAFGSKKHKDYIEVRESCSDVELEIMIDMNRYKISRPLFEFDRPAKIHYWNEELQEYYKKFDLLDIDTPKNENSLSAFLLGQLGLSDIKVANQTFSFRDLYKYCYIKQSKIDSENLLDEKHASSLKRKDTLRIILNTFNELRSELKSKIKEKEKEIEDLKKQRDAIVDFISKIRIVDFEIYLEQKQKLQDVLLEKQKQLSTIKIQKKSDSQLSLSLENQIKDIKGQISKLDSENSETEKYIGQLQLLRNQYVSELERMIFIIESYEQMNQHEFILCPSCLNTVHNDEIVGCKLCGQDINQLGNEELEIFKSNKTKLKSKVNNLSVYLEEQMNHLVEVKNIREIRFNRLREIEENLDRINKDYVSPFLAQVEQLNLEIGTIKNELKVLEENLSIKEQLAVINQRILEDIKALEKIKEKVSELEKNNYDEDEVLNSLSDIFLEILKDFNFPKLSSAYIHAKQFLPYVRNVKYDELGGGGALTMITMAYYLSILVEGTENESNHPGILLIDTPRKNLGSSDKDEAEFKDEKIFNSIISYFIDITSKYENKMQLIVTNNGCPSFVPSVCIIKEFDQDGTKGLPYGLIDDINK